MLAYLIMLAIPLKRPASTDLFVQIQNMHTSIINITALSEDNLLEASQLFYRSASDHDQQGYEGPYNCYSKLGRLVRINAAHCGSGGIISYMHSTCEAVILFLMQFKLHSV